MSDSKQDKEEGSPIDLPKGPGAPANFGTKLEDRLRDRSAGRFFGKSTIAEKIPFVGLAVVLMIVAGFIYWMQRSSDTGTLTPVESSSLATDVSQIRA